MKTSIIIGALVISTGAFAQERPAVKAEKQIGKAQTEVKEQVEKVQQNAKEKVSTIDRNSAEKTSKDKVNEANIESENIKIGQGRAAEARAKAATVKTKSDAEAMIRMSKEDTKETMNSINEKMVTARKKLMDKLASGEITQAQFDVKIKQLMEFEKRKSAIMNEME